MALAGSGDDALSLAENSMKRWGTGLAVLAWLAAAPPARAESAADWDWRVTPYFWGPSVSLDVTAKGDPVIGADASLSDLLDKTDLELALHFEGECPHAGVLADALYVDLGAQQTSAARPPLPGGTVSDTDLKMGLYEAGGFYRAGGPKVGVDLIFGVRVYDLRAGVDATIPAPIGATRDWGTDKTLVDGFAGVRYRTPIGTRWQVALRADAATGGTDLTWNSVVAFTVRFGKTDHYHLALGWRHLHMDVTTTNASQVEIENVQTLTGPTVGFVLSF